MSNYPPGVSEGDIPGFRPQDNFDDDAYEQWAENEAYGIIVENLESYLTEYSGQISEHIISIWTLANMYKDWTIFNNYVTEMSSYDLLIFMARVYMEENEDDLLEEYTKEQEDNRNENE